MKKLIKIIASLAVALTCAVSIGTSHVSASSHGDEFLVGMEAGYPPFNWTQQTDANNAAPIQGSDQYANGYDVQIARRVADRLGKKLVVVKTKWDGLIPALTSGKIDAIIAGMSPTPERRQAIDFSKSYYTTQLIMVVNSHGKYTHANSIQDFKGAKITAQQGTFHYDLIPQIHGVDRQPAMSDFSSMRVAVASGKIDGYVGERPEGITAQAANSSLKMITFNKGDEFKTDPAETQTSVGVRKGDKDLSTINSVLASIPNSERLKLMDQMTKLQSHPDRVTGFWNQVANIFRVNGSIFLQGALMTLYISIIGTLLGALIGLLIGIFRTTPKSSNVLVRWIQRIVGWVINVYIEIFRGTPMMVQAMVIYYGSAQFMHLNIDRTLAAFLIVSINTGAYMTEIIRGGIVSVDSGQFEAAQALGMTHGQTMLKVVLPQAIRNALPAAGNEFVINIKDTSVLNVISVSELFFQGNTVAQQNYLYFQTFFIICAIYFVLTFTVTRILRFLEKRLDHDKAVNISVDQTTTGANQLQI